MTPTIAVNDFAENPALEGALAVTVIEAVPGATAVMLPDAETTATLGFEVPKVTVAAGAPFGWTTVQFKGRT